MPHIKMYTTDFCPYCDKAKRILEDYNLEFEDINIHGSFKMRAEIEKLTGRRDVPQIFIDDVHIGDDDDLADMADSGKLDELSNGRRTDTDAVREPKKRWQWFRRA
jgi:glutaredoxin 3